MTIVVGLGNPGKKYQNTRHNVGWRVLDAFAETLQGEWKTDKKLRAGIFSDQGPIAIGPRGGASLVLLKPLTFMNRSGLAVASFLRQNKKIIFPEPVEGLRLRSANKLLVPERSRGASGVTLLVLHDDIDLPLGTVRVSSGASAGGHNGVASIIDHLGTKDFWRLRIGVAPQVSPDQAPTAVGARGGATTNTWKQKTNPAAYVLKPFTKTEQKLLAAASDQLHRLILNTIEHPKIQTVRLFEK